MIGRAKFNEQMLKTAVALNREMDHLIAETYWETFSQLYWTNQEFESAMQRCRQELDRFPTIHQIKQMFKLRPPKPVLKITNSSPYRGTSEEEARLDALTDQEILDIARDNADFEGHPTPEITLKMFRAGKGIWRAYLRDCLN